MRYLLGALRLAPILAVLPFALYWRTPPFANHRLAALALLLAVPCVVLALELWVLRGWRTQPRLARALSGVTATLALAALLITASYEAHFRWVRHDVLRADPAQLARFGRHILVGYRDMAEITALVERGAVAGIFLSPRNLRGRSQAEIRAEIDALQEIRRRKNLPPLLVAADQEGGLVSRLSPPLRRMPPLSEVIAGAADAEARRIAVRQYATAKAADLAQLGVNVNFAPVVDMNHKLINPDDRHTRIHQRAISTDPAVITEVAETYCATLQANGVRCTLKHFPGLGRVFEDTHKDSADLTADTSELAASDWVPFRRLMKAGEPFVMLGHVRLTALDPRRPVSFSRPVVDGLLRSKWGYPGVLITDDFSMGAVQRAHGGIGAAGIDALNAGVDLILISYDCDQFYFVMRALLQAEPEGRIAKDVLARSAARLARTSGTSQ